MPTPGPRTPPTPAAPGLPYFMPQHPHPPGAAVQVTADTPTLFRPLQIRSITLKNRIMVSPMCQYSTPCEGPTTGTMTDYHLATLGHYAIKGVGLIMTEATAVQPNGRISPHCPGLWNNAQTQAFRRVCGFLKSQGCVAGVQLSHAGRKGSTAPPFIASQLNKAHARADAGSGGWPDDVVAPTGGPNEAWDGSTVDEDGGYWPPRELTLAEIRDLVQAFGDSAKRAVDAGFDVIELHASHGYLLHQFFSPLTNRRTDQYGGSFENRIRLLLEITRAVRAQIPDTMPLFVRVSATDWMEDTDLGKRLGSWTLPQTLELARLLPALGVDLLDVSSGENHYQQRVSMFDAGPQQHQMARQIRQTLQAEHIPLLIGTVGLITEAEQARDVVDDRHGQAMADVISVGRQFQREPEWVLRVAHKLGVDVAWPCQSRAVRFVKI